MMKIIKGVNRPLMIAVLTLISGALFYQVAVSGNHSSGEVQEKMVMRPVPTVAVISYVQSQSLTFPGHVQARNRVELAFNVPGQIVEMNVVEGATFTKGEVLAKLDQRDFKNNYDAAEANAIKLEKEFKRIERLLGKEVVSQAEYDNAKSSHEVAQANLSIMKKALGDTVIRAPFDGVVAKRYVDNYQHIKENERIFSYKDISFVEVAVEVPERIVARTKLKSLSEVMVSFDADKVRSYPAAIREFSLQSDPITRTYTLVAAVMPPENLNILPGMTATVAIDVASIARKIDQAKQSEFFTVPIEAVFEDNSKSFCWIIPKEGGYPEKRQVELGELHNGGVVLRSGVKAGDNVATAGLASLDETLLVRPLAANWEGLDG